MSLVTGQFSYVILEQEKAVFDVISAQSSGGTMKTVIAVTFISILSGVIVMSAMLSPATGPQGTPAHALVSKAEYERWQRELSNWGRWGKEFMMTIAPLRILRGTGSPVNPIAMF